MLGRPPGSHSGGESVSIRLGETDGHRERLLRAHVHSLRDQPRTVQVALDQHGKPFAEVCSRRLVQARDALGRKVDREREPVGAQGGAGTRDIAIVEDYLSLQVEARIRDRPGEREAGRRCGAGDVCLDEGDAPPSIAGRGVEGIERAPLFTRPTRGHDGKKCEGWQSQADALKRRS